MLYLKTFYDKDIFPTKKISIIKEWSIRKTVKIVLLNKKKEIALITNSIHKCCLLPGGGIDNGEDLWSAADRECREETRSSIIKGEKIGVIKEYRARDGKMYETFGVVAHTFKKIQKDLRTDDEKNNELIVEWHTINDVNKIFQHQYELLMSGKIEFYNIGFNIARDKLFFDTALKRNILI